MQRTKLRIAGYLSILFGLFWIVITTLGFVYLISNGESSAVQNESIINLCNMFFDVWYNPALKIYNFNSAPVGTAAIFWCIAILIIMLIFFIAGIKLIKYSNEDYDLKENVSKSVMFIIFTCVILIFAIYGCTLVVEIGVIMYVNLAVLILMFVLPIIECIKEAK